MQNCVYIYIYIHPLVIKRRSMGIPYRRCFIGKKIELNGLYAMKSLWNIPMLDIFPLHPNDIPIVFRRV